MPISKIFLKSLLCVISLYCFLGWYYVGYSTMNTLAALSWLTTTMVWWVAARVIRLEITMMTAVTKIVTVNIRGIGHDHVEIMSKRMFSGCKVCFQHDMIRRILIFILTKIIRVSSVFSVKTKTWSQSIICPILIIASSLLWWIVIDLVLIYIRIFFCLFIWSKFFTNDLLLSIKSLCFIHRWIFCWWGLSCKRYITFFGVIWPWIVTYSAATSQVSSATNSWNDWKCTAIILAY